MDLIKHWKQIKAEPKMVRQFGFILSGLLFSFGLISIFRHHNHWKIEWPLAAIALLCNLFAPKQFADFFRTWMLVAEGISWVVLRVILGIVFYLILTPISFLMRLKGNDILDEKLGPETKSYWISHETKSQSPKESYERLF